MKLHFTGCVAALATAALLAVTPRAQACAGCRNPSLATARGSEGALAPGAFRLGASLTGTTVHVVHEAGCADVGDCHEVPVQPLYVHDQHLYPVELRLSGEYGINRTFGVELQLPYRMIKTTIRYSTPDGQPYTPLDPDVHHRNETVHGLADPWLLLRMGTLWQKWWLAARPGVSLPLAHTEENPFELGDRGLRHQHIQLGSGTFDPVLVLEAARSFKPITLEAFAQGQASLYRNTHGYQAPWRVNVGAAVGTKLFGDTSGALGAEMFHDDAERWDGVIRQDGSLGRSELLAAVMLRQALGKGMLSLSVRVPLWRDIVVGSEPPGTLSSPATLSLGYSHTFGDADEHEEHEEHEATPAQAGSSGAAPR